MFFTLSLHILAQNCKNTSFCLPEFTSSQYCFLPIHNPSYMLLLLFYLFFYKTSPSSFFFQFLHSYLNPLNTIFLLDHFKTHDQWLWFIFFLQYWCFCSCYFWKFFSFFFPFDFSFFVFLFIYRFLIIKIFFSCMLSIFFSSLFFLVFF